MVDPHRGRHSGKSDLRRDADGWRPAMRRMTMSTAARVAPAGGRRPARKLAHGDATTSAHLRPRSALGVRSATQDRPWATGVVRERLDVDPRRDDFGATRSGGQPGARPSGPTRADASGLWGGRCLQQPDGRAIVGDALQQPGIRHRTEPLEHDARQAEVAVRPQPIPAWRPGRAHRARPRRGPTPAASSDRARSPRSAAR